jgi:NodT family efflux transporter outer membrane factor (OMF) lipoprotein
MSKVFSISLLCLFILSGCTGHKKQFEQINHLADYSEQQKWWRAFADPLTNQLVTDLIRQNLNLQMAIVRIEEARALKNISKAALLPDIPISGEVARGNLGANVTSVQSTALTGLNSSWALDIFGASRAALRANELRLKNSEALAYDVKRIIVSDLTAATFNWHQANHKLEIMQNLFDSFSKQTQLLQARYEAGVIEASTLEASKALTLQTAAQLPLAKASIASNQYQIECLLGQPPGALEKLFKQYKRSKFKIPQPEELSQVLIKNVLNRADIRAALFNLLAAQFDLKQAELNLWPQISVSAFFGVQKDSAVPNAILPNPVWSLASNIAIPFINFGRLRAAVDFANAKAKLAFLEYEDTVLTALKEAHTALSDYLGKINAMNKLKASLKHKEEEVELARQLFDRGITEMTALTTAENELYQTTITFIQAQSDAALAFIEFYKSVGA